MQIGHNRYSTPTANMLRSFMARIERLQNEKQQLTEDIAAVFAEAKAQGFDTKAMKTVLKVKENYEESQEHLSLVNTYLDAMGQKILNAQLELFLPAGDNPEEQRVN